MKLTRSALLGGAFLLAASSASFAQSLPGIPAGVYLRGDVGGAFGNNVTFKDTSAGAANSTLGGGTAPTSVGNSVIFGGGIGYRFMPMLRGDFTLDYIPNLSLKGTASSNSAIPGTSLSGSTDALVGMANAYFDFGSFMPNMFGPFSPYIDGGIGFARDGLSTLSGTVPGVGTATLNGRTQTNFAWGVGAGASYALTPNLSIDAAYKYLDLGSLKTGYGSVTGIGASTAIKSDDLTAHTFTVGLRWTFGAPPAPPPPPTPVAAPAAPPPAAVAPAKQMFIVFFEFDKSSLTPDGKKVVDAAAAAFKAGKSDIAVAGYTDLAGTQQYNLALSHRRADTVKAALVGDGVPAAAIGESWYGKQNPRVPTADGVREPQNRRVEITM